MFEKHELTGYLSMFFYHHFLCFKVNKLLKNKCNQFRKGIFVYAIYSAVGFLSFSASFVFAADRDKSTGHSSQAVSNSAPSGVAEEFDLKKLWDEMRLNNPQLVQARESYLAAKAMAPQASALNNPQIGLQWNNMGLNSPAALGRAPAGAYTLTQAFSFPGKKTMAGDIADKQAEAIVGQNDTLALQLASQLVAGYYGTLAAQKQLVSLKEAVLRLDLIKNIAKARYANNAAAYVEYLNAQVAQSSAEADRFAMEKQLQVSLSNVKTLIGRDPRGKIILKGDIHTDRMAVPTLLELEDYAENSHPILQSSRFQLEAAQKAVTLAKMAYLPDFQIIATSNTNNAPLSSGSSRLNYSFELDVIVPLYFFTKERYGVEQAVRNQYASQAADVSVRQQLLLAVQTNYANYEQAKSQYQFLLDRQLPEAEAAYKLALNSYANNGTGFNDLLTAQSQLRSLQVSLAVAQSNLLQAYAALLAASGKEPI